MWTHPAENISGKLALSMREVSPRPPKMFACHSDVSFRLVVKPLTLTEDYLTCHLNLLFRADVFCAIVAMPKI